ncbi:1-phosphofructokinase family hexose kinase [Corynebacterium appendicis]|uniref:1-phosphofructokinase family hexose kinase n=1 Tax=Corynebacterium appendicis TaxID=163202 RepID=UPI0028832F10|nr:1-phosphofructokinase family hexose kinase [Corynebacterium appendicis]
MPVIVTFTANPSIDATLSVVALDPGDVLRVSESTREPGGKGINVSNAVLKAGRETIAVIPASEHDPFVALAGSAGIPLRTVRVDGTVRTNTTVTEKNGRTTKLNEPGAELTDATLKALETELTAAASEPGAEAAVLAGSLPPGAPADWYATLVRALRGANSNLLIAVDTSDEPLKQLGNRLEGAAPDVVKPNAFELGQLAGLDGDELERRAESGDLAAVINAAKELVDKGIGEVLVTLGGAGACLVTARGAWHASPPPAQVRSTVGAGDSSLAGYLLARLGGSDFPEALRNAVAYGTAAASNPGTEIPSPDDIDLERTAVREL